MKRIEIKTSDQVIISFDIADIRTRALAFAIDFSILFGMIFFLSIAKSITFPYASQQNFQLAVILPIFLFYTLFFEIILNGQTPGKKAMNLRVIKLNGHYPTPMDYIILWIFRWLDIWMSFFVIGTVLINSTQYGQRLGDMMAGTILVKLQTKNKITLREILNIDTKKNYNPHYTQVTLLSDKDMILVKNTISRYQTHQNEAHRKVIHSLANQLRKELKIKGKTKNDLSFLKTLLKDYVVLTR